MSIKLLIEIEGPLGPDDKDILTGATMILLALSQRYAADEPVEEAQPCGDREYFDEPTGPDYTGRICISPVGHKGRHKYRPTAAEMAKMERGLN